MIKLKKIHKFFSSNGITALNGADFELRKGEIHALLGENGAGKSTLMHIMAGFMKPGGDGFRGNPGTILVSGWEERFSSPARALAAGIGMIRQRPRLIPGFPVWENCVVGSKKYPPLWINRRSCRKKIADMNDRFRFDLPLDSPVELLTVSQEQKAAILTLLMRDTQYLIFDEPTAVLSPAETKNLFEIFFALRDEGKGIALISHKLEETLKIADRVTVLRQGMTQACSRANLFSNEDLYELIFGLNTKSDYKTSGGGSVSVRTMVSDNTKPPSVLTLHNLTVTVPGRPLIRGINLELKQGKIMGIAGVQDSGLETLELAVTGFLPFSGTLEINETELTGAERSAAKRVRQFRAAGGSCLGTWNEENTLPIRDMLLIHAHRCFQKWGILKRSKINKWMKSVMAAAQVPCRDKAACSAFSGGQLQRLLLTREMAGYSALLVLSDPGRNLDMRYREKLVDLLRIKAEEKTAVLIFSTDIDELLACCDSIAVLRNGVFSGLVELTDDDCLQNQKYAREMIREAMVG